MAKSKKAEAPMMVKMSTVKEFAKSVAAVNVSGDFCDALNQEVASTIEKAVRRATDNKRSTIQPRDL